MRRSTMVTMMMTAFHSGRCPQTSCPHGGEPLVIEGLDDVDREASGPPQIPARPSRSATVPQAALLGFGSLSWSTDSLQKINQPSMGKPAAPHIPEIEVQYQYFIKQMVRPGPWCSPYFADSPYLAAYSAASRCSGIHSKIRGPPEKQGSIGMNIQGRQIQHFP